jgi:hypothetical protein
MKSPAFAPYLALLSPDGKVIAFDANKPNDDYAIIMEQLPVNGTYRIIATSRQGETIGNYTLTAESMILWREGELSSGNQTLKDGSWYQDYAFQGRANQEIAIYSYSNHFVPYILLVSGDGKVIAQTEDVKPTDKVAGIKFRLPKAGSYRILVSTLKPGQQGKFNLMVQ